MGKLCRKCGWWKPLADFPKHKRMLDGYTNSCKECTGYATKLRKRDKGLYRKKQLLAKFGGACKICGGSFHPSAMDFHHKDPAKKTEDIGRAVTHRSMEFLETEAKKCIILCANCHRKLHWEERNGI